MRGERGGKKGLMRCHSKVWSLRWRVVVPPTYVAIDVVGTLWEYSKRAMLAMRDTREE